MVKQQYIYTCDICGNEGVGASAKLEYNQDPYDPVLPKSWRWFDDGTGAPPIVMCLNHQVTVK